MKQKMLALEIYAEAVVLTSWNSSTQVPSAAAEQGILSNNRLDMKEKAKSPRIFYCNGLFWRGNLLW